MNKRPPGVSCWDFSGVYKQMKLPVPRGEILVHDMTELPGTNCYCDDAAAEKIRQIMREEQNAGIHFTDTGNYHYLTCLYLSILRRRTLLIVFDHHTDMQEPAFGGLLSCGGWIKRTVSDLPQVVEIWVIGPEEQDIEAVHDSAEKKVHFLSGDRIKAFRSEGAFEENVLNFIRTRMQECLGRAERPERIYISVDKDILSAEHASCPWSQGDISLDELSFMLSAVLAEAGEAGLYPEGIDICGESVPDDREGCIKSERTDQRLYDLLVKGKL